MVKEPSKRLRLEDIENHIFLKDELPDSLPVSSLVWPPSMSFLAERSKSRPLQTGEIYKSLTVNTKIDSYGWSDSRPHSTRRNKSGFRK